jgi:glycosyltransferase involved in cell wall biosynthesis
MYRRHAWGQVSDAWVSLARSSKPDVLYFDHLDSFLYHQFAPQVPSVIDLHNIYSLLAHRTAEEEPNWLKRAFLRRQARLLAAMESKAARECTALLAVSHQEAEHFRSLGAKAVHAVPNGVDYPALADLPVGRPADQPVVLFLGTMSWRPNAAAASFLAINVMPRVRLKFPSARLLVVGRDPPPDLKALSGANGVVVTGGVPDVKPYLLEASVMAVPLDTGGGTRLKILEAFAAGLPVVSTSVGAEGIDATPGTHLILAERPAFAAALVDLLSSPAAAASMATEARVLARDVYDWQRIGRDAAEVVRRVGQTRAT